MEDVTVGEPHIFEMPIKEEYIGSSPRKHAKSQKVKVGHDVIGSGERERRGPWPSPNGALTAAPSWESPVAGDDPNLLESCALSLAKLGHALDSLFAKTNNSNYLREARENPENIYAQYLALRNRAFGMDYRYMGDMLAAQTVTRPPTPPGEREIELINEEELRQTDRALIDMISMLRGAMIDLQRQVKHQRAEVAALNKSHEAALQHIKVLRDQIGRLHADNSRLRHQPGSHGGMAVGRPSVQTDVSSLATINRTGSAETATAQDTSSIASSRSQAQIIANGRDAAGDPSGKITALRSLNSAIDNAPPKRRARTGKQVPEWVGKRPSCDMSKLFPHVRLVIPPVPLTDGEIIIYFFNSIARSIVALRLYSRGWTPSRITDLLNKHRRAEYPYLKNTCSIKCTGALKNGKNIYGEEWMVKNRAVFSTADDIKATDMLRTGDQKPLTENCDVSDMLKGLDMHAEGDNEGIFTLCVKYCVEKNIKCRISELDRIANELKKQGIGHRQETRDPVTNPRGGNTLFRSPELKRVRSQHMSTFTPAVGAWAEDDDSVLGD
ncbi:hypothetical protein P154DRAFT_571925 [Amniculicola lignicola CBS 123094]|uniref:Uncharacterized protein n=1 Tax=Amniculicola lignicola CBS 123094 TaxID=1392246 RepID=A0A6A5WVF0_9PLEO|nr:hypothetical protein P154DRAFT_571925 [Amniculicola lignicola CBS 123094]